jgi:hypothetical protein
MTTLSGIDRIVLRNREQKTAGLTFTKFYWRESHKYTFIPFSSTFHRKLSSHLFRIFPLLKTQSKLMDGRI